MDNYTYLYGYRLNPPDNILTEIDAYAADGQKTSGNTSGYSLVSQFGRLNYSFADKYLLEANIRRDGASNFADGHKWGTFPSVSVGWRISSESFMKNVTSVQDLKLRASWGELGNNNIGLYPYQANYSLSNYPFNGTLNTAAAVTAFSNTNITWETTKTTDVGVDFTVFRKLGVTFDYFDKVTSNILLQLPIPETVGLGAPYQNAGKVGNKGWELALNYRDAVGKDFKFSVGASLADVRNKILDIKGTDAISTSGDGETSTAYKVGQPIGAYYGYMVDGIFQTQAQVAAHATQPGAVGPGDFIYRDVNGDGKIDDKDKVYLGSNIPRYTYGINLSASYKGFDFGAVLQGVGKVSVETVYLEQAPTSQDGNFRAAWANSWTPTNTGATLPRLVTSTQNYQASSYWVQSGAYMRLKSTQLGYTFPTNWTRNTVITKVRLYVSGQNLLTFSKLPSDIDPETTGSHYYPQVKIFTFGLNANF
jgi:TonB-linked SusC/RagA family outer membrane protein